MRRLLPALAACVAGAPVASAQTKQCTAPAAAAAVGYNTETFNQSVNVGQNWFLDTQNGTTANVTKNSDGSVTIAGGGDTWNGQLQSASSLRNGEVFGGGFYAQATVSVPKTDNLAPWNGGTAGTQWPSFWANNSVYGTGSFEADFMEMMDSTPGSYNGSVHNWTTNPQTAYGQSLSGPSGNLTGTNTYGFRWVPATANTDGSMTFYLNGQPVGKSITWTQANPGPYGIIDETKLALYLGAGPNSPMTVSNVQVWQASTAGNLINGQPAPAISSSSPNSCAPITTPPSTATTPQTKPAASTAARIAPVAPATDQSVTATTSTISTPTATATPCGATASGAATGAYTVQDGHIIGPDGTPFIAKGIGVMEGNQPSAATLKSLIPGINFVRLAEYDYPSGQSLLSYVNALTSAGIVVEIEDHNNNAGSAGGSQGVVFTGAALTTELSWYTDIATTFKSNPMVWFGTDNEPSENPSVAALSQWQGQTVQAIRATGNTSPVMVEMNSWSPASTGQGYTASVYAAMKNIIWDIHYYGWISGYSTSQNTVTATLSGMAAQAQTIKSADGTVPVIVGEYGNSTNGTSIDPNGSQVLTAVQQSGLGAAAWGWMGGQADGITSGNGLSSYGQEIAGYIALVANAAASVWACTGQAATASGQQAIAQASKAVTTIAASASGQPSIDPTVATIPASVMASVQASQQGMAAADASTRDADAAFAATLAGQATSQTATRAAQADALLKAAQAAAPIPAGQ